MVFQNYAVFPHMTIRDNIAFGLRMKKAAGDLIEEKVQGVADMMQIGNLLDRYPGQLSGGQGAQPREDPPYPSEGGSKPPRANRSRSGGVGRNAGKDRAL